MKEWISKIKGFLTVWNKVGQISRDADIEIGEEKELKEGESRCPYCQSKKFVKRGKRKKKLEVVQLYICKNSECGRTFTAQFIKGKHYPLNFIIEGISYYNLGFGLEDTCRILKQKFGVNPGASTLGGWIKQYSSLCRYDRLRSFAMKLFKPQETIEVMNMAHRQIYRFMYHRAKIKLTMQEYKNRHFEPLKDYLDGVSSETPHQYFQDGLRISEIKTKFDKSQMIVRSKFNYANRLADFVLQTVKDRKKRHEMLQRFFIANDSVTVAVEVPVYIRREDIEHMQNQLGFKVIGEEGIEVRGRAGKAKAISAAEGLPRLLTGHIDLLQIRNGQIHILDYKPNADKEKPIEQLTWYALALSRLTGLRLYEFKCAWFDEKSFYEFYPLHVVKKIQEKKKKRKVFLRSHGQSIEVPEGNQIKIV